MKISKLEQPMKVVFPLSISRTSNAEFHEKTYGTLHWIRARLYGECPTCHGTHNKRVFGWKRLQCEDCGKTWTY